MSDQLLLKEIKHCENELTYFQENLSFKTFEHWPSLMLRLQNLLNQMPEFPANHNIDKAFHSIYLKLEDTIIQVEQFKKDLSQSLPDKTGGDGAEIIYDKFDKNS